MALDGAFLYALKQELGILIGARIDKIHQPSREEVVINFRTVNGSKKLLISVSANSARVHVTNNVIDNPTVPPRFCMLLRKHLGGGKLFDIRQVGLERILFFDFECINELGDRVLFTLAAEIMGKYSNIVLINEEGKVIDSIKRVGEDMSKERLILPGMTYEMPSRRERLIFLTASNEEIVDAVRNARNAELSKALINIFEGISPILAREWSFYATKGFDVNIEDITQEMIDRLVFIIGQTKNSLLEMKNNYTIIKTKEGMLKDFSFIRINQYGMLMYTMEMPSAFDALDYFYTERDNIARLKQRANDLFKLLVNTSERITKRIVNQKDELEKCKDKDHLKLMGDLISANIYRINKGDESVLLENFYDENCPVIEIKLDKSLTPAKNAQKYYSEYRKAGTAEEKLTEQIRLGEEELSYIDSVFDALTRASTESEINELRLELAEQGYIRFGKMKGKASKALPPLEFISSDGYTILVGRNNKQNDKLSMKMAGKMDLWLHTQNITGSHVIILTNGEMPPGRTIEEAAIIAAYHSKARNSSQVPVDYTFARYVKKPNGAKPGMVIFTNNKTVYIKPDEKVVERLKVK
ncbi:MAG: fibronectin/fibrinogen-binding protein [Clostridiales bacterium]|jgi:predicted ribosome quality control (RQC) complex YloA/Tae2 family protein|nr:fibronectin/fibrinogen-binding protein [Clostridiales bacterium]